MAYDFDDDLVNKYLNSDDKTKTDALFEKINETSKVRSGRKHTSAPKALAVKAAPQPKAEPELPLKQPAVNPAVHAQQLDKLKKQQEEKKRKRKKTVQGIALGIGSFIIVLVIGFVAIAYDFLSNIETTEIDETQLAVNEDLHANLEQTNPALTKITNIALFGIDARAGETESRSDAVMILSVNPITNKIKLISVMRDSYVNMDGTMDKLTHAYYYGGPELAVKTLNMNFGMNITDYVTVNFASMAEAIDALGGVYVDVDEDELYHVNKNVRELNKGYTPLEETGYILLTGERAVGYARIRAIDSDKARTGRQREVVMAAFDRVKEVSVSQLPGLAKTIFPMIETSMSYSEIISFLPMLANDLEIEQAVIPGERSGAYDAIVGGIYYLGYDLDLATQHIYDFIYNDIHPDTDPDTLVTEEETEDVYSETE